MVLPAKGDQELLARVCTRSRLEFIGALREATGCTITDAKGIAEHVVSVAGHCHRCSREIRDRLLVDCPRCSSLNIQLARPAEDVTCPACGFAVLADGYGSYELCRICGWEDDGAQLANPTSSGGANHHSLADAQATLIARIPLRVKVHEESSRDPLWRPLGREELAEAEMKRRVRHWHTASPQNRTDVYWLRTSEIVPAAAAALAVLVGRDGLRTTVTLSSGRTIEVWNVAWGRDDGEACDHIMTNVSPYPSVAHEVDFFYSFEIIAITDPHTGQQFRRD